LAQYYSFKVSSDSQDAVVAVPDGTIDILFHTDDPVAVICGSVKKGKHVHFEADGSYFGARFFPGQAEKLLDCPLEEFTEKEVLLEDVVHFSSELIERIISTSSFSDQVEIFESFQKTAEDKPPLPFLVKYILNKINSCMGDIRIQELADETGYSTRHINNLFRKHVGITPKLYIRIVRFQRGFGLIRSHSNTDFADLAEEMGYYDQAHFINEFKEFSLTTPGKLFAS
ncbi:MAG: helix-turn-helix domain-containing protein, partial [Spirochaetales bacterium]|nr:helix-turn-helix domain-containing protein [Spirochaetales bacterium]